jgi:hypothetical protein
MRMGKAIYNLTKWFGCKSTLCEAAANGDTVLKEEDRDLSAWNVFPEL